MGPRKQMLLNLFDIIGTESIGKKLQELKTKSDETIRIKDRIFPI